jgi:hypothetical protein
MVQLMQPALLLVLALLHNLLNMLFQGRTARVRLVLSVSSFKDL